MSISPSRPLDSLSATQPLDFSVLAERHLDDVYGYLLYLTRNPALAEDLAADAFEKALRRFKSYDHRRGEPRVWLLAIARSTALDHFRAEKRRLRREEAAFTSQPLSDEPELLAGLSPALKEALWTLSPQERELVFLRVVLEIENERAAKLLGISPSNCSTRLSRTLTKLETKLEEKVNRYEL